MKTWTYREMTAAAEERIKSYTAKALATKDDEVLLRRLYLAWAYGAFTLWDELTRDRQQWDDKERLRSCALNLAPHER